MAFVKFSRGLTSSYNNLRRKDPDTLYLVYDSVNALNGKLYLGEKLISSVGNTSSISLNDLLDISASNPQDGMLLQYNANTAGQPGEAGKWEAVSLEDAIGNAQIAGNNIAIVNSLESLNDPSEEDIAVVGSDVFIRHNDEWIQLSNSELEDRITNLEESVGHAADIEQGIPATGLYKEIADLKSNVFTKQEILEQIADLSHLTYQIVNSLEDIDETSDEAATTIYLVPKNLEDQNDGYDEYFVIDETLEKIGNFNVNLDNYIQDDDNRLLTEEQKKKLDSIGLDENDNAIIQTSQVADLINVIQSNSYINSVDVGTFEVNEGKLSLVSVPGIDLSGYVQTTVFEQTVGDLNNLTDRANSNSTIVDEINLIKESIVWKELSSS